ncbi:microtubule-associated protein 9-like [Clytia hemisphaerica]|uniref:Ubiquitin-like domain-containing protein n=1 Tax=Clytia hemisphaerica TaxID=252671 RepID=A0A7M5V6I6_9CNID
MKTKSPPNLSSPATTLDDLPIRIFVHCPNENIVTFNQIKQHSTINEIKSQLELRTGILAELQSLYFSNVKLEDGRSLREKHIKNGSVLRIKVKERSLQQIYTTSCQGNISEVFQLGVEYIDDDSSSDDIDPEDKNSIPNHVKAWNSFVPLRAFQALFAACYSGHLDLLTKLVDHAAANIGMLTKNRHSLLHVAAFNGHLPCVSFLLSKGANPKLVDLDGMSALSLAAMNGHLKVEKHLWLFNWNMEIMTGYQEHQQNMMRLEKRELSEKEKDLLEMKETAKKYKNQYNRAKKEKNEGLTLPSILTDQMKNMKIDFNNINKSDNSVRLPDIQNQKKSNEKRKTKKKQKNEDLPATGHESQTVTPLNINPQQPRHTLPAQRTNHSRTISAPAPIIANGMPQLTKYSRSSAKSLININSSSQTLNTKNAPTVVLKSTKKQPLNTQFKANSNHLAAHQNLQNRYGNSMTNLSVNGENGFHRSDSNIHQNRTLIKQSEYSPNFVSTDNRSYAKARFARVRTDYSPSADRPPKQDVSPNPQIKKVIVKTNSDRLNNEYSVSLRSEKDQNDGYKIPSTKYVAHDMKTSDSRKQTAQATKTKEGCGKIYSDPERKESTEVIDAFLDAVINKSKKDLVKSSTAELHTSKDTSDQPNNVTNKSLVKDSTKDLKDKRNLKVRFAETEQNENEKRNEINTDEPINELIARYPELMDTNGEEKMSKVPKLATVMVDSIDLKEGSKTREIITTDPDGVRFIDVPSKSSQNDGSRRGEKSNDKQGVQIPSQGENETPLQISALSVKDNDGEEAIFESLWQPINSQNTSEVKINGRFVKTFDEWLDEKNQQRKQIEKSSPDVKKEEVSNEEEKNGDTNERMKAYKEWYAAKEKEIKRQKRLEKLSPEPLRRMRTFSSHAVTFEKWLERKRQLPPRSLTPTQQEGKGVDGRPPVRRERIRHGMTFEEWKKWKEGERKQKLKEIAQNYEDSFKELEKERCKELNMRNYELWLERKNEEKKINMALEKTIREQKEESLRRRKLQKYYDPHMKTFEEWLLEKKYDEKFVNEQRKMLRDRDEDENFGDADSASNAIFEIWLTNKFAQEMQREKGKLNHMKYGMNFDHKDNESDGSESETSDYEDDFESDSA